MSININSTSPPKSHSSNASNERRATNRTSAKLTRVLSRRFKSSKGDTATSKISKNISPSSPLPPVLRVEPSEIEEKDGKKEQDENRGDRKRTSAKLTRVLSRRFKSSKSDTFSAKISKRSPRRSPPAVLRVNPIETEDKSKGRLKRVLSRAHLKLSNSDSSITKVSRSKKEAEITENHKNRSHPSEDLMGKLSGKISLKNRISNFFHSKKKGHTRRKSHHRKSSYYGDWRDSFSESSREDLLQDEIRRDPSPRDDIRRPSLEEHRQASLLQEHIKIVSIDLFTLEKGVKDQIKKNTYSSLGTSVNHVWPMEIEEEEKKRAFVKSGGDVGEGTITMEAVVWNLAVMLGLKTHFAPTKKAELSPGRANNLIIKKKRQHKKIGTGTFSKKSSKAKEGSSGRRRSLSDCSEEMGNSIKVSIQLGLEGKEWGEAELSGETLYETFSRLILINSVEELRSLFRIHLTRATWIAVVMSFFDAHRKNIIINSNGLNYFDNARSCTHSNDLIIQGDKMRLPLKLDFLGEKESYEELSDQEIGLIKKLNKNFLDKFKFIRATFFTQEGEKLIKFLRPECFSLHQVMDKFYERLGRIQKWVEDSSRKKTLDSLVFAVFPYYRFFSMLYLIHKLLPDFIENQEEIDMEEMWRKSVHAVGAQDDVLDLIDGCFEMGINIWDVHNACVSSNFSYEKLIQSSIKGLNGELKNSSSPKELYALKKHFYNLARVDYKDIPTSIIKHWLTKYLYEFCKNENIPYFDRANTSPQFDDCIHYNLHECVFRHLLSKGYFLTFREEIIDEGESYLYCYLYFLHHKGGIKFRRMPIFTVDGRLMIRVSNYLSSMEFVHVKKWLEKFVRNINDLDEVDISLYDEFTEKFIPYVVDAYWKQKIEASEFVYYDDDANELNDDEDYEIFRTIEAFNIFNRCYYFCIYRLDESEEHIHFELIYRDENGNHQRMKLDVLTQHGKITFFHDGVENSLTFDDFKMWIEENLYKTDFEFGNTHVVQKDENGEKYFTINPNHSVEKYRLEMDNECAMVRVLTEEPSEWMTISELKDNWSSDDRT